MMVPVLMYHHISPLTGPHTVTPELFRDHLKTLSDKGIRTLSLDEFAAWRRGELAIQQPAVLLTFDDAWLDNWAYALPVLEEFSAQGVFFVVTSWPGAGAARVGLGSDPDWRPFSHAESMKLAGTDSGDNVSMRWSELLAARDTGLVSLASHSHGHGDWWKRGTGVNELLEYFETDLRQTADVLEAKLGACPPHLCWPKGHFCNSMMKIAEDNGFIHQYSTLRGSNQKKATTQIRRINVENRPGEWLWRRLTIYGNQLTASALGVVHQNLHYERMKTRYPNLPRKEFVGPRLHLI
ncbi:polysaccharide deacetylase family protein [Marinobacter sp. 71-i]|uniref:Polysaccharide deacetylase family protein n=1 Tax=Marinobacter iranensis TaxID=2962607 RepID=A0ABT5YER4_9GAMM|nr:polysaccharide deacetylase family protein [Marinobacter iranensis]MDF0752174.1 polysaccharide deacetylase family protein [Marinobacter iranensis]